MVDDDCAMTIIACKHKCGRRLDMRILEECKSPKFWLIYGICKSCDVVLVSNIFMKFPVVNVDYLLDYTLIAEGVSK
jgi:hypothetical protein